MKLISPAIAAAIAAFAAVWLWGASAAAQDMNNFSSLIRSAGVTPAEVATLLTEEGAQVSIQSGEQPVIAADLGGLAFQTLFFNCEGGRCTELLFIAGFDLPDGVTLERINDWNREEFVGRAFIDDESDPFLDHPVTVDGGLGMAAVRENLALWVAALVSFAKFLGAETGV